MAPGHLRALVVDRVDLVDKGANQDSHIRLLKSEADPEVEKQIDAYMKRDFSADDRKRLASSGAAMSDGSFPIENKGDLHNAMQAVGRAKDPAKAKSHIRARAKALGLTGELGDAFKSFTQKQWESAKALFGAYFKDAMDGDPARTFDQVQAATEAGEFANSMMCELNEMLGSLQTSICEIMDDDAVADKQAALNETFTQFKTAIAGAVPEEMEKVAEIEKAAAAAILAKTGITVGTGADIGKGATDMTDETKKAAEAEAKLKDMEKAKADAEAKAAASDKDADDAKKALAKALHDVAVLKMSAEHQDFLAKSTMADADKAAFVAKSAADRDAVVKASAQQLPESVRKQLEEAADVKKRLEAIEKRDAEAAVAKRAGELGLATEHVETLAKAYKGDGEAIEKMFGLFTGQITELKKNNAALTEQVKAAGLFKEIGTSQGADTNSAVAKVNALVAEIRKSDTKLRSDAQALTKIAEDPQHADLWKAYRAERQKAA